MWDAVAMLYALRDRARSPRARPPYAKAEMAGKVTFGSLHHLDLGRKTEEVALLFS